MEASGQFLSRGTDRLDGAISRFGGTWKSSGLSKNSFPNPRVGCGNSLGQDDELYGNCNLGTPGTNSESTPP